MKPTNTLNLEDAARITGRAIKVDHNGFKHIVWRTDKHKMEIQMAKAHDKSTEFLLVCGTPLPWTKGSEVRRGRPRPIWVTKVTARYLISLR